MCPCISHGNCVSFAYRRNIEILHFAKFIPAMEFLFASYRIPKRNKSPTYRRFLNTPSVYHGNPIVFLIDVFVFLLARSRFNYTHLSLCDCTNAPLTVRSLRISRPLKVLPVYKRYAAILDLYLTLDHIIPEFFN